MPQVLSMLVLNPEYSSNFIIPSNKTYIHKFLPALTAQMLVISLMFIPHAMKNYFQISNYFVNGLINSFILSLHCMLSLM